MTAEPTRERVAAYEAALGCRRVGSTYFTYAGCSMHHDRITDLGCPVAVAAARVEAERVAEVEAERDRARENAQMRTRIARDLNAANEEIIAGLTAERDALRAAVEKVRALHQQAQGRNVMVDYEPEGTEWLLGYRWGLHEATLALPPEPATTTREGDR